MISSEDYDFICSVSEDVSKVVFEGFRQEILSKLGSSVSELFPEFSLAFPRTVEAMEEHWTIPVAAFRESMGVWLCSFVLENGGKNIFFNLHPGFVDVVGENFDEDYKMLPVVWKEMYRYFDSFTISERSVRPLSWLNTPFSFSGRMFLEEYRVAAGLKKKLVKGFSEKIGSDKVVCWVMTDGGDSLFIDERRCDKKVYHVYNNNFEDFSVIHEPDVVIDNYLSHLVATGSSSGFDFRR